MLAHESSASHKNTQIPSSLYLYAIMPNICWLPFLIILYYPLKTYCFPKYCSIQLFAYYLLILYFPCIWEFFFAYFYFIYICECIYSTICIPGWHHQLASIFIEPSSVEPLVKWPQLMLLGGKAVYSHCHLYIDDKNKQLL